MKFLASHLSGYRSVKGRSKNHSKIEQKPAENGVTICKKIVIALDIDFLMACVGFGPPFGLSKLTKNRSRMASRGSWKPPWPQDLPQRASEIPTEASQTASDVDFGRQHLPRRASKIPSNQPFASQKTKLSIHQFVSHWVLRNRLNMCCARRPRRRTKTRKARKRIGKPENRKTRGREDTEKPTKLEKPKKTQ